MERLAFIAVLCSLCVVSYQQCPAAGNYTECRIDVPQCDEYSELVNRFTVSNGVECATPCSVCALKYNNCPMIPCASRLVPVWCEPKFYTLYSLSKNGSSRCHLCDTYICTGQAPN